MSQSFNISATLLVFSVISAAQAQAAPTPNGVDPDLVNGKALLGLRIPVVVASPFTRGNRADPRVVSTVFDNTSILKLITVRFGLDPLPGVRAGAGDMTAAFDFTP